MVRGAGARSGTVSTAFSAFPIVGIYGSIKGKIVLQHYAGARSLHIQEGRQDNGRKTAPPSRRSGTQLFRTPPHLWTPPLVSHVRTPAHLRTPPYSDTHVDLCLPPLLLGRALGLAGCGHTLGATSRTAFSLPFSSLAYTTGISAATDAPSSGACCNAKKASCLIPSMSSTGSFCEVLASAGAVASTPSIAPGTSLFTAVEAGQSVVAVCWNI